MKTICTKSKTKPPKDNVDEDESSLGRNERSRNRWPTEKEIMEVSKRLARISRKGIQRENAGDYFKSGDLAYQLHEIIRTTDDLFKQIKRIER